MFWTEISSSWLTFSTLVIGIGRYGKIYIGNLSVSADKEIGYISDYRYQPIWKNSYRSYTELAPRCRRLILECLGAEFAEAQNRGNPTNKFLEKCKQNQVSSCYEEGFFCWSYLSPNLGVAGQIFLRTMKLVY